LSFLHPFLFGLFPVLALWAANVQYVRPGDTPRAAGAALLLAGGLMLVFRALARRWEKSALLASAVLIIFFAYGHVYGELKGLSVGGLLVGRHRYLLSAAGLLLLLVVVLILRGRGRLTSANQAMAVAGLVLILPSVFRIASYQIRTALAQAGPTGNPLGLHVPAGSPRPDVYYIIVDGYGRGDVLEELYDLDNRPLLQFLEQRGFYVADSSRSNYGQTLHSLASSLNLAYIQELPGAPAETSDDRIFLDQLIRNNLARRSLAAIGYQFAAFETTFNETSIDDADLYYIAYRPYEALLALNAFESQLLSTSLARLFLDMQVQAARALSDAAIEPGYEGHRNRILFTFATLPEVAELDGDFFVFAHILAPHAPFVFGPTGDRIPHTQPFTLKDTGSHFESPEEYVRLYRDQVIYVNRLLTEAIDRILELSDTPPVIILQGDHGPGAHLDWEIPSDLVVRERYSILNAYLVPEETRSLLYPEITPVNSFRALFDGTFGADLPLLEDRVYFTPEAALYRFLDVTEISSP
jgi:hypothetical protein